MIDVVRSSSLPARSSPFSSSSTLPTSRVHAQIVLTVHTSKPCLARRDMAEIELEAIVSEKGLGWCQGEKVELR
jgi:hypothetical protein